MTDEVKVELIKEIFETYYSNAACIDSSENRGYYQEGILDSIDSIVYFSDKSGSEGEKEVLLS